MKKSFSQTWRSPCCSRVSDVSLPRQCDQSTNWNYRIQSVSNQRPCTQSWMCLFFVSQWVVRFLCVAHRVKCSFRTFANFPQQLVWPLEGWKVGIKVIELFKNRVVQTSVNGKERFNFTASSFFHGIVFYKRSNVSIRSAHPSKCIEYLGLLTLHFGFSSSSCLPFTRNTEYILKMEIFTRCCCSCCWRLGKLRTEPRRVFAESAMRSEI